MTDNLGTLGQGVSLYHSSVGKESACNAGDPGSIPGWGRTTGEGKGYPLQQSWASLMAQLVKNLQCGRPGFDPWVGKIPWRRERLPTPGFWPGEFHGLYSPWGGKESDTTERLFHFHSLYGAQAGVGPEPGGGHETMWCLRRVPIRQCDTPRNSPLGCSSLRGTRRAA